MLKETNPDYSLEGLMLTFQALILSPPDAKSQITGKDPDARKDWEEERGTTEDEMVGCHHGLNGPDFQQTLRDTEEQGSLQVIGFRVRQDFTTENNNKPKMYGIAIQIGTSVSQSVQSLNLCPTLCDPMNPSMPGLPVHHQLLEFTQTCVHRVSDAIQPSHLQSSPSSPPPNPSSI